MERASLSGNVAGMSAEGATLASTGAAATLGTMTLRHHRFQTAVYAVVWLDVIQYVSIILLILLY